MKRKATRSCYGMGSLWIQPIRLSVSKSRRNTCSNVNYTRNHSPCRPLSSSLALSPSLFHDPPLSLALSPSIHLSLPLFSLRCLFSTSISTCRSSMTYFETDFPAVLCVMLLSVRISPHPSEMYPQHLTDWHRPTSVFIVHQFL